VSGRSLPLATVLLVLCGATAGAGVLETVRQKYGPQASIATEVDITTRWYVREKTESHSGRLYLAPGGKFRVELDGSTWGCDGRDLWQYSSQANQLVVKPLSGVDLSDHPSQMLSVYLSRYAYRTVEDGERQAVLQWLADSASGSSFYRCIRFVYDKKKGFVTSLTVTDRQENQTTYLFRHTVFGRALGAELFTLNVPKGARVLDERQ
jgi:outer membrane lipoprotein-sorting protein